MVDINAILDSMHDAMQKNPLFGDLLTSEDREFLLKKGLVRTAGRGMVLCKQNQRDNRVFLIINGAVEITEDVQGEAVTVGHLASGELFGEIAALFMMPRIATVTVAKPTVLLEIPGEVLEELISRVPVIRDAVFQRYRDRTLETGLRAVPAFASLPDDALRELADSASMFTARKGDLIIKEGEQGDALYIVNYGAARVYITKDGEELNLALLRPGDYFGERSLLTGALRAASVSALTQVEAVRLGVEEFLSFIQKYPEVRDSVDRLSHERHEQTEQARNLTESVDDIEDALQEIQQILGQDQNAEVH